MPFNILNDLEASVMVSGEQGFQLSEEDASLFSGVPCMAARELLSKEEGAPADCALVVVEPGGGSPDFHEHEYGHIFFVIEGSAFIRIGDGSRSLTGGQALYVPGNTPHSIINIGESELRVFSLSI